MTNDEQTNVRDAAKQKSFDEYEARMQQMGCGSVKWTTYAHAFCDGWEAAGLADRPPQQINGDAEFYLAPKAGELAEAVEQFVSTVTELDARQQKFVGSSYPHGGPPMKNEEWMIIADYAKSLAAAPKAGELAEAVEVCEKLLEMFVNGSDFHLLMYEESANALRTVLAAAQSPSGEQQ